MVCTDNALKDYAVIQHTVLRKVEMDNTDYSGFVAFCSLSGFFLLLLLVIVFNLLGIRR